MKHLIVFARPRKLEALLDALAQFSDIDLNYAEARGYGRQKGHLTAYHNEGPAVAFLPKIRLAVTLPDNLLEGVLDAITLTSRTGRMGDGKILVLNVETPGPVL